jgi:hypothetical protein
VESFDGVDLQRGQVRLGAARIKMACLLEDHKVPEEVRVSGNLGVGSA